jgi:hypothetical protein
VYSTNQESQSVSSNTKTCAAREYTIITEASRMPQDAWKVAYSSLHYPVKLIGLFPPQEPAPAPASTHQPNKDSSKFKVHDIELGNGVAIHDIPTKYELILVLYSLTWLTSEEKEG